MSQMECRALGRTGLRVSAVGFGTSQLRRVTPTQAIDTLLKGFDLGVNIVHTAPDYEGAEDLVATAIARTSRKVMVASNGYDVRGNRTGRVRHFQWLFDTTCRRLKTDRLDLYGIVSVEDREALGQNVWGGRGMVEFLQRMKARGRLRATFCTTHGSPEFARRLIESGAFDAVMLAYNDLGFHALTLNPPAGWHFEDIRRTGAELLPLCKERGVGVMVMLPLAGGLLVPPKAFPPEQDAPDAAPPARAADALCSILSRDEVSCVLPGTASVEEAEENARAGHGPAEVDPERRRALAARVAALQASLCSRCGLCEPTCSQALPISWLFRAGDMSTRSPTPYETWEDVEYFRLHPKLEPTCDACPSVTCACPAGIHLPRELVGLHRRMVDHARRGLAPPPVEMRPRPAGNRWFGARVVRRELPAEMRPGRTYTCRLHVENRGLRWWHPPGAHRSCVRLRATVDGHDAATVDLRHKVVTGGRCHFVFELTAPLGRDRANVSLRLVRDHPLLRDRRGLVLYCGDIPVREGP